MIELNRIFPGFNFDYPAVGALGPDIGAKRIHGFRVPRQDAARFGQDEAVVQQVCLEPIRLAFQVIHRITHLDTQLAQSDQVVPVGVDDGFSR